MPDDRKRLVLSGRHGGPGTAILTYRIWQSRFGGDPRIVGRTILLNKRPFTVAGVMQKGFESDPQADAWLALQADPNSTNQGNYLSAVARLNPGVDLSQARATAERRSERAADRGALRCAERAVLRLLDAHVGTAASRRQSARTKFRIIMKILSVVCASGDRAGSGASSLNPRS